MLGITTLTSQVDKIDHISTTIHAIAKLFTPVCSPGGGDLAANHSILTKTQRLISNDFRDVIMISHDF